MSVLGNSQLLMTPEGYQISRSVRLRSSASAYFNRTPASAGNQQKWTLSSWVKRGRLGAGQDIFSKSLNGASNSNLAAFYFDSSDRLVFFQYTGSTTYTNLITTAVYRDPSAWYHIQLVYDDAQSTAANRVKMYVNGTEITSFSTASYPTQNFVGFVNQAEPHAIGRDNGSPNGNYLDGYLTEINFIDGQALTPSSFGETNPVTGVWQPKKYAGTYGTNGFYLNFSDNSAATAAAIGKDYSGNGNNWTPNNISVTAASNTYDSMIDVPTPYADGGNGRGNYAVINPLANVNLTPSYLWGNLNAQLNAGSNGWTRMLGSMGVSSGKWYVECEFGTDTGAGEWSYFGIKSSSGNTSLSSSPGAPSDEWVFVDTGFRRNNNSSVAYGTSQGNVFILRMAVDLDNGRIWWGDASGWFASGDPAAGTNAAYTGLSGEFNVLFGLYRSTGTSQNVLPNFGQRPFAYTPPTGFKALNTQNLPEPTIKKGNQYFDATLYTGTGSMQSIVNAGGFEPAMVWGKSRSSAFNHGVTDAVRGAYKGLLPNSTTAEDDGTSVQAYVNSFNSNGFTVNAGSIYNGSGSTYVAWQWKESASAGFDIVTYTGTAVNGQTFAHSLGVAPSMIIIKGRSAGTAGGPWYVYHKSTGATNLLRLNTTAAAASDNVFNYTAPTSSVFTLGAPAGYSNASGETYIAYLFAEVAGFSKFGSYTGNGSTDGTFVYCGFRPRFIMIKRTDTTSNWVIWDTARDTYNAGGLGLYPNLSAAEDDYRVSNPDDILSNGFKPRANYANVNASGGTYIFMAVAENPFKYALAR